MVRFELLASQRYDTIGVEELIKDIEFGGLMADKAFDANWIIADLTLIHPLIFSDVFSITYERPINFTAVQQSVVALTALGCRPTSIGYGRCRRVAAGYSKVD